MEKSPEEHLKEWHNGLILKTNLPLAEELQITEGRRPLSRLIQPARERASRLDLNRIESRVVAANVFFSSGLILRVARAAEKVRHASFRNLERLSHSGFVYAREQIGREISEDLENLPDPETPEERREQRALVFFGISEILARRPGAPPRKTEDPASKFASAFSGFDYALKLIDLTAAFFDGILDDPLKPLRIRIEQSRETQALIQRRLDRALSGLDHRGNWEAIKSGRASYPRSAEDSFRRFGVDEWEACLDQLHFHEVGPELGKSVYRGAFIERGLTWADRLGMKYLTPAAVKKKTAAAGKRLKARQAAEESREH